MDATQETQAENKKHWWNKVADWFKKAWKWLKWVLLAIGGGILAFLGINHSKKAEKQIDKNKETIEKIDEAIEKMEEINKSAEEVIKKSDEIIKKYSK